MYKIERRYAWNDESLNLLAQIQADELYLEVNRRSVSFRIVPGAMGSFVLQDGDRVLAGYALASDNQVWVELDGRTYVLDREKTGHAGGAAGGAASGEIASPMTGTVRKVFVEAGQLVAAGAPILVVEAMKMEFNMTAPFAAQVRELLCEAGQSVDLGQVLMRLDPAGDSGAGEPSGS